MTNIERIRKMRDPKGFRDLWLEEVKKGKSYVQAYDDLEEEYNELIKEEGFDGILKSRRYSSYDSFRISKNKSQQAVS